MENQQGRGQGSGHGQRNGHTAAYILAEDSLNLQTKPRRETVHTFKNEETAAKIFPLKYFGKKGYVFGKKGYAFGKKG